MRSTGIGGKILKKWLGEQDFSGNCIGSVDESVVSLLVLAVRQSDPATRLVLEVPGAALAEKTQKSAVLIVAQRISTVMNADKIIVLKQGVIAEAGTHSELLELNGIYRRLHDTQFEE